MYTQSYVHLRLDVEELRRSLMPVCPHHKYKTNETLISYITGSSNVNFDFQFREFQLYNHTQYLDIARINQDRI